MIINKQQWYILTDGQNFLSAVVQGAGKAAVVREYALLQVSLYTISIVWGAPRYDICHDDCDTDDDDDYKGSVKC